jgi:2-methylcitrate dehydratase PrpD
VKPLIHHRPVTGAQGKFSLEYGVAAAVFDDFPGLWSFTDAAVMRPGAQDLLKRVRFVPDGTGEGLLDGNCQIVVHLEGGSVLTATLDLPDGAPDRPPSSEVLAEKAVSSLAGLDVDVAGLDWPSAASLLKSQTP